MSRTIKLFGLSEAKVDQTITALNFQIPGLNIGFYPRFPENHLVLTLRGTSEEDLRKKIAEAESRIYPALEKHIFGYDDDTLEEIVARLLTEKKMTLAVAESCTGGLITDRLTNVPGSSLFLERGVVSYSNESKVDLLGVPAKTIETFGAVSEETARLMAEGVRKLAGTDIGIGVTGIAGPTGGTVAKPTGTVYVALADREHTVCRHFQFRWERRRVKEISTQWALEMLRRHLTEGTSDE
jgi:nicotinamide-nucleotide amidase